MGWGVVGVRWSAVGAEAEHRKTFSPNPRVHLEAAGGRDHFNSGGLERVVRWERQHPEIFAIFERRIRRTLEDKVHTQRVV